mgnify:FL=1
MQGRCILGIVTKNRHKGHSKKSCKADEKRESSQRIVTRVTARSHDMQMVISFIIPDISPSLKKSGNPPSSLAARRRRLNKPGIHSSPLPIFHSPLINPPLPTAPLILLVFLSLSVWNSKNNFYRRRPNKKTQTGINLLPSPCCRVCDEICPIGFL